MLNSLHVKNLALIEETEVEFGRGLNILTGETGAGKSVIIGSINLALGAKADKDMIRTGKDFALVELIFTLDSQVQRDKCRELEIEPEDDTLIISRKISSGKSLCRVNGETVTAKQLKELSEVLIDVYGQHEHQSLTGKKKQAEILDDFCGTALSSIKEQISGEYKRYRELLKEWNNSDNDSMLRQKEIDLISFEIQEIEDAQPEIGEDEKLEAEYRRMSNARKIMEGLSAVCYLLGNAEGDCISEMLGRALREMKGIDGYDEALTEYTELLSQAEDMLLDVRRGLADYEEDMGFEPEDFDCVERRLDLLNHIKSKYGNTIEAVFTYREKQEKRLELLSNYDEYLETLQKDMQKSKEALLSLCKEASDIRKEQATALSQKMAEALRDLNFQQVSFEVRVTSDEEKISGAGYDEVEFFISTNPGEPIKPLGAIASGGELSRIMLGLKVVMAQKDAVDTLIFDEIDAGISGKTAWQVSKKLAVLGSGHQVICITHLPQIAAMADIHFKIEKMQEDNHTKTDIFVLEEDDSIAELARLLGSDCLTESAIANAKEMKELAANTKQY